MALEAVGCVRSSRHKQNDLAFLYTDPLVTLQKLIDLKKKLTAALNEVDDELAHTARGSSCSRR